MSDGSKGGTFTELQGKFITVCILEALRNVHNSGVVHRDIKPDNILMDSNGYAKLADFGIAEFDESIVPGSQFGTISYMAPEIIFEHSYSYMVDYYSLGVLLLLMLTGDMLTVGKNVREARKAISMRRDTMTTKRFAKRYNYLSEECCDLIVELLTTSQHQRIGSKGKVDEIFEHEWFEDIDIKAIQEQTMVSPLYDIVTDKNTIIALTAFEENEGEDTMYWMQKEKKAMRMISKSYVDYGNYWKSNFHAFKFMDVHQIDNKSTSFENSLTIRKHALSSISKKREESLSHIMHREGVSAGGPSDFTRLSTNKSGCIDPGSGIDFNMFTPESKKKQLDQSL